MSIKINYVTHSKPIDGGNLLVEGNVLVVLLEAFIYRVLIAGVG